jgi:3-hydroxyacyl-CoA dehydrogenase
MPVVAPPSLVAVIGSGAMGSGIAQIAAQGGFEVVAAQLRLLDAVFPGGRYRASSWLGDRAGS